MGFKWAEGDGVDDRWRLMETGPFFSGTLVHPGGPTIKGLGIKLGDQAQASICFDTELLRVSCGWTRGFLKFSPARYGLISPPSVNGLVQFTSPAKPGCTSTGVFEDSRPRPPYGPLPEEVAHYQGLSVHGRRVVLHYTIGIVKVLESPWAESSEKATLFTREWTIAPSDRELKLLLADGKSAASLVGDARGCLVSQAADGNWILTVPPRSQSVVIKAAIWNSDEQLKAEYGLLLKKSPDAEEPAKWTQPGPARWGGPLVTQGRLAAHDAENPQPAYVVDTLTVPFENPYKALMFLSGHDFFANGDAAVCTAHGDVWLVRGIDSDLKHITWKRFATGLFQPLGLKIVREKGSTRELVYVLGRDQITTLYDFNEDGEADFYRNFNNAGQATPNSHEFATCLETDSQGNFYYLRGDSGSQTQHDGCLLRVSPDGRQLDVFATGFRNANGLGIGPDDTITVAPQEGTWTPGSAIFRVERGGFYGAMQSHHRAIPPTTFEPPICWIPRQQDNSSGGQVWVTSDHWGPLKGQLLHFSFGTCRMFLTLRESVGKATQGGTLQFPFLFDSGVMRGRFRQTDGQLYVTGLKGWVSSAVRDGCFQRVRYTGHPVNMPVDMRTYANGIALTFAVPLKKSDVEDPDNFSAEQWNYHWSGNYGSPEYKVSNPNQIGHDEVEVVSSTLLADGKTVFLEVPDLRPAMQVAISYTISSDSGDPIRQTFNATLHQIGQESQPEMLVRKPRSGQLPAEIEVSLKPGLLLKTEWGERLHPPTFQVTRLAAVSVPESEIQMDKLLMTWTGYIRVTQKSEYRFFGFEGSSLDLDGHDVEQDVPLTLGRGYHAVKLSYLNKGKNGHEKSPRPAQRLQWKSDGFPLETVPPTVLFHRSDDANIQQAQSIRAGRDAFQWRGCANCHKSEPLETQTARPASLGREAPNLLQIGNRVNPEWLAAWIERPHQIRPQALMPSLFDVGGADNLKDEVQQHAVVDLVAYFKTIAGPGPKLAATETESRDAVEIAEGRQLYQSLGCMGCHCLTAPQQEDDYDRLSLYYVAAKFRTGALAEFLRRPQQHYGLTRMPDFQLSERESRSLESFLRTEATGQFDVRPELSHGNAERGAKVFLDAGCGQCHSMKVLGPAEPPTGRPEPKRAAIAGSASLKGCLATERPPGTPYLPDFQFAATERQALHLFLTRNRNPEPPIHDGPAETQALMRRLKCSACHSRDGQNSPLAEIVAEEGDGLPAEAIPHLTWAGEKLKPSWMERLLKGELKYKTRQFLKARMPAFPAYSRLAADMAMEHGFSYQNTPKDPEPYSAEMVELGHQLTLKTKGLDCRQCHGVADEQPSGDKSTLISPGINFSITGERMNFDFLPQLLMNPPRYDPSSRMPVFSVDGKTTAAKGILDGDAMQQFEAIREYLRSVPPLK